MPSTSENYQYEASVKIGYDTGEGGDGILWAKNPNAYQYYFYRFAPGTGTTGQYLLGGTDGTNWSYWLGDYWISGGYSSDYNKLSVRKYGNNYYFFLNEVFVHTESYGGDYGNIFGFWAGTQSQLNVEGIGLWTFTLNSKKSDQPKLYVNTPRVKNAGKAIKGTMVKGNLKLNK